MTRINLVPPEELFDQHLFAEWREIKMIPKALRRSLLACGKTHRNAEQELLRKIPKEFTLNTGHVFFFYDKILYLEERYRLLTEELVFRNFSFTKEAPLDPDSVYESLPSEFHKDYQPTQQALSLVRERIALRVQQKPGWYRNSRI